MEQLFIGLAVSVKLFVELLLVAVVVKIAAVMFGSALLLVAGVPAGAYFLFVLGLTAAGVDLDF